MKVERVEILVEEPSMEAAIRLLVPKIAPQLSFEVYAHQGKEDLLGKLPKRLRGYARFLPASWRVLVVVDRDGNDCRRLKEKLERIAQEAGLVTRSKPGRGGRFAVANRIAIEELEAWFFGDWSAVRAAFPKVPAGVAAKAKFRNPDAITGGTWEALERVLQDAGYMVGGFRKIETARAIAERMEPRRNTSQSFDAFHRLIRELAA